MTKLIDLLSILNTRSQREKKRSWMALFSKITPPLRWRCTPELEVEMGTVAIVLTIFGPSSWFCGHSWCDKLLI